MKFFTKLLLTLVFCTTLSQIMSAQILACNTDVHISLGPLGTVEITPFFLLEGSIPDGELLISVDGGTAASSYTLDCSSADGTFQYTITNSSTGNTCWGTFTIEDKLPPIAVCQSNPDIQLIDGKVELSAYSIDAGSNDNCPNLRFTFDAFAFDFESTTINGVTVDRSVDHYFNAFGPISAVSNTSTQVLEDYNNGSLQKWIATESTSYKIWTETELEEENIIMSVTDVSGNHIFCTTFLSAIGGDVLADITVPTQPWSCEMEEVFAEDLLSPNTQYDNISVSADNANFSSSISNTDYTAGDNFYLYVKYDKDGINYFNIVSVECIDIIPPVVVVDQEITVYLSTGNMGEAPTATITPEQLDDGSYDVCSDITLSISQSVFYASDIGENTVMLRATDEYGNYNEAWTIINVIGSSDCDTDISTLVQWPSSVIDINNSNVTPELASPEFLEQVLGFPEEEVYPQILDFSPSCVIGIGSNDQVIFNSSGWTIMREFTVMNWSNSSTATFTQTIINDDNTFPTLACINNSTVLVGDTPVQLYAVDLLVGFIGNPADLSLEIEDESEQIIPNNLISSIYDGQELVYSLTHPTAGSCWGTINVVYDANQSQCIEGPGVSFEWPTETTISISDPLASTIDYLPNSLINNYGFTSEQVLPQISNACASILDYGYGDIIVDLSPNTGNFVTINRNFTVINWSANTTWTFTQVINNTVDPDNYICDFLPRTAPLGDCESGHTDTDDVEWPTDLQISDYRTTPEELVNFSGVDVLDSSPSFYNDDAGLYNATYEDQLVELTATMITLGREWTVERSDNIGLSWTYTQQIEIDITDFDNLIVTTTFEGLAIADVEINSSISTDLNGKVIYEGNGPFELYKESDFFNGVDIRDLTLMSRHLQEVQSLSPIYELAGDVNNNGVFDNTDMIEVERALVGLGDPIKGIWKFTEKENTGGLNPKEVFIGAKAADMDDSNLSVVASSFEEYSLVIDDLLLNAGEEYTIELNLNNPANMTSAQYVFDLDENVIQLDEVEVEFGSNFYKLDQGVLDIVNNISAMPILTGEEPILKLRIKALNNGILSEVLTLSESKPSMFIDENLDYQILNGTYNGIISSTFDDPANALSFVNVYPNPTVRFLNFDFKKIDSKDINITIMDLSGRQLIKASQSTSIDVSELTDGMYIYQITDGSSVFMNKFLKLN